MQRATTDLHINDNCHPIESIPKTQARHQDARKEMRELGYHKALWMCSGGTVKLVVAVVLGGIANSSLHRWNTTRGGGGAPWREIGLRTQADGVGKGIYHWEDHELHAKRS